MPAAQATRIGILLVLREERLRREHDGSAFAVRQRLADEALARTGRIGVGGVDEVDALLERVGDDGDGILLGGAATEHHRSEAQLAYLDARSAEVAVFHG